MAESKDQQENLIHQLQKEKQALLKTCADLQQTQLSYEKIIGENNTSLLKSDMACMELEQIFSAYTDSTWVIREDGIVIRANPAMLKMLGKSAEEVIGKACSTFLDYGFCDQAVCPLRRINRAKTLEYDVQLSLPNTDNKKYLLTIAPLITINGSPGIVEQFKEITSRKQAEEAL
ncbi:MAG: PAS domain S-box protein, partial [Deltaproteobacteria bacterium]|nr:PAS domain S-box protein [Deltaproteobacteria bacterium]